MAKVKVDDYDGERPHEALAQAIIMQAVRDYRNGSTSRTAEIERFFLSEWFKCLTPLNGEWLLHQLQEERRKKERRKKKR